jgi:hypothetical protein
MFPLPIRTARGRSPNNAATDATPQQRNSSAINHLHPDLLDLLRRTGTLPPGDLTIIPENDIAHAVSLALGLVGDDEQAFLVSRIMTDAELAARRLRRPDVRDMRRNVLFNAAERRVILSASPESEEAPAGTNSEPCIICEEADTVELNCGCAWCPSCIREGIRTGLRSEVAFPPRCRRFNGQCASHNIRH